MGWKAVIEVKREHKVVVKEERDDQPEVEKGESVESDKLVKLDNIGRVAAVDSGRPVEVLGRECALGMECNQPEQAEARPDSRQLVLGLERAAQVEFLRRLGLSIPVEHHR